MRVFIFWSFAFFLQVNSSPSNAPDQVDSSTAASRPKPVHNIVCWDGISGTECKNIYGCGCSDDGGFYDGGLWPMEGDSCTRNSSFHQTTNWLAQWATYDTSKITSIVDPEIKENLLIEIYDYIVVNAIASLPET